MSDSPQPSASQPEQPQQPQHQPEQPQQEEQPQLPPYAPQPPQPGYAPSGYGQLGYPESAQPGYAQPGYAQPGYSQPGSAQAGYGAAPADGTLGRTALIIAAVALATGVVFSLLTPALISGAYTNPWLFQTISAVRSVVAMLLAAAGLILGILAVRRRSQPVLGGIAIGIGAAEILGTLAAFLSSFLYAVL